MSVDPIYAYFDVDERTVLRGRQLIREGKAKSAREGELPLALGLVSENGFPHRGVINFVDNQVNPKTGTLRVRGVFPNPDEALSPGFFARVRVPMGQPHPALLVSDRALDNDQGQKILYVVDDSEQGRFPPRSGCGRAPRRVPGHRGRAETGRAGDRRGAPIGSAGHERRAEARTHAGLDEHPSRRFAPPSLNRETLKAEKTH